MLKAPHKLQRPFRAIQAVTDLAVGVQNLHEAGILHGDLRPSNVVVDENSSAQIVDYGLLSPWAHGKARPDYLAGYLAPEDFLAGSEPTPESDIYVFGKIARAFLKVTEPPTRAEEQLLRLVIAECLRTEPADRPTIQRLVTLLRNQHPEVETSWQFDTHRQAVLADIDARVPDLLEMHLPTVSRSAWSAIAAATRDVSAYNVYRMALLQESEIIHFLSTLSLTYLPKKLKVANTSSNNVMLKPVKYPHYELVEGQDSRSPVELLDTEWRGELERINLGDIPLASATPGQTAMLSQQLEYAAELRAEILQSDGFVRSEDVAAIMSPSCPGITAEEVRVMRDMGYMIGLPDRGITLYPIFQFDSSTGLPYSCIKTVQILPEMPGSVWRRNVWWFLGPHAWKI